MKLSEDGKVLLKVSNEDIVNGTCVIPDGITSIGRRAFDGCTSLTQVNLPDGLASIGDYAFAGCTGLTQMSLPNGLTSIGDSAFSDCTGLTQVNLPDGLTSIGVGVFYGCTGLTQMSLPDGLTSIDHYAFHGCTGLTQRSLPDGLTSIGENAFEDCTGLTQMRLPEGLTSIGNDAFSGCTGLTQMRLPEGLTSIGDHAFRGCTGLTQMSLPEGLTSISGYAFRGCTGLTQMTLPEGITSIGTDAFAGCTGLQAIVINSDDNDEIARIKNILPEAFHGQVIQQSLYNNVLAFQTETHQTMLNYLGIQHLTSYSGVFNDRLPVDLLKMLASFDVNINNDIEERINALGLPTTPETFDQYKNAVAVLLGSIPKPTANDIGSRLLCIQKLQAYVDTVNDMKEKKMAKYPTFFDDNRALSTEISGQLALCQKIIEYLKGGNDLLFTQNEMDILNKQTESGKSSFLAQTLDKFSITLPMAGLQTPHPP